MVKGVGVVSQALVEAFQILNQVPTGGKPGKVEVEGGHIATTGCGCGDNLTPALSVSRVQTRKSL